MTKWLCPLLVPLLVLGWAATPASAQTPPPGEIPPEQIEELLAFFNRVETIRMTGDSRIAPGTEVVGDLGVVGGPLHLAGRVRGRVVVLNGDVRFSPGAEVTGDLTVVGGSVVGLDSATVGGRVLAYRAPLRYQIEAGRLVPLSPPPEPVLSTGREFGFGRTDLTFATHRGYNRVEGLPVVAGPRFETRSANPTRAEAFLIYRTESGFEPRLEDLGYLVKVEQYLGGRRAARVGATLHSEIVPIEAWGLSDRENSLATFVLRRDHRDHYERTGWSAYLRFAPSTSHYDATLTYRDERHGSPPVADPWALFGGGAWRPQPRVAEGRLRSVALQLGYDSRNEGLDPTTGWYVQLEFERGLGGSLSWAPAPGDPDDDGPGPLVSLFADDAERLGPEFATAFMDIRRYARLSPISRLGLRIVAAGSLNDWPLPPQRQHALGGEGMLPGYGLFRFDCGARSGQPLIEGFYPYYGCDRLVLFQLEYQTAFPFLRGWGRKLGQDIDLGERPGWVVFFDAGRAWTERVARVGRDSGQDDFAVDAGVGLRLGRLGLYWAVPLSGSDNAVNFFVRLDRRF